MRMGMMLVLMAVAGSAAAMEPCAVPPGLVGFATPAAMPVAARGRVPLTIGQAMRVTLAKDAKPMIRPDKAPAAGTYGAVFGFTVARPGRYRVAIDQPLWIEVADRTTKYGSAAHGHAPACSGARKMVDYDLKAGFHVVQLSGAAGAAAVVLVAAL